jgi:hypothetical protein
MSPMISGTHAIIFSKNAEADREFFRAVLRFPHVDAGDGWLIFALPPSELAVHPDERNGKHEVYLMCDDIKATIRTLRRRMIRCTEPRDQGWGLLAKITLPGGGKLGLYQPKHPVAHSKGTIHA